MGVSPIWPPSGVALAFFVLYGFSVWPGVLLGMIMLSFYAQVPSGVALIAGLAAIAESVIPLIVVKIFGFKSQIDRFRDALLFIAIVTLGPIISSASGAMSMFAFSENLSINWINIMTLWWLGNSIGMLVFGGLLILIIQNSNSLKPSWQSLELFIIVVASFLVSYLAFTTINDVVSALAVHLLIPLVFFAGLRISRIGALIPAFVALTTLLSLSDQIPNTMLEMESLNILYLDLVEVWFITLAGFLMTAAMNDHKLHYKTAWLATHDPLTGLENRTAFNQQVNLIINGNRRSDNEEMFLFIDLDQMKQVNDVAGHLAGDQLLVMVAEVLKKSVRESDFVARWGGDEFCVLLENCSQNTAENISRKILRGLENIDFAIEDPSFKVTSSIGITKVLENDTLDSLINRADKAAYLVKNKGKNDYLFSVKEA